MSKLKTLWVESYRPKNINEYVFQNENQRAQMNRWIEEKSIPHLLFSGSPGTGKTTAAKMLANELDIDPFDFLEINASKENGIDAVREKLTNFVSTMPFGDFKVVLLDECVAEDTLVAILREGKECQIPIKDIDENNDLIKSYNIEKSIIEWKPFSLMNKGIQDVLEIEFENGEVIICTPTHKWYVEDPHTNQPIVVKASELFKYDHILTPL
jgi:Cdc6-like AAA superfamily ATPase